MTAPSTLPVGTDVSAQRLRRLEVWSALECAGGARLAIWPEVIDCVGEHVIGLDARLTVQVPLDAAATALADRWLVVRIWDSDSAWDEWVILSLVTDDIEGRATLTAARPSVLLGRAGLVTETVSADGVVRPEVARVGLPPATLVRTLVVEPAAAMGLTWLQIGTVESTAVIDVTLDWVTPLVALTTIADAAGLELDLRRVGTAGYAINLVTKVGATAPTLDVRHRRNLTAFGQDAQATEHATVLAVQGAASDGLSATMARAVWRVTALAGTRVTLADPAGGVGPIGWDRQLDTLALRLPDDSLLPIVSSRFSDQSVVVDAIGTLAVDALVEVRTAGGQDVISLPCPPAVDDWGVLIGTLQRTDLPGHRNYVANPAMRTWAGDGTAPPAGWATVGTPTLLRLTAGETLTRGEASLQVAATASGSGVVTPTCQLVPRETSRFIGGYFTLWVVSGQVRVELVTRTALGVQKVYPTGTTLSTSQVTGQFEDLGLAGIDAFTAGVREAELRVVQHGTTPATWIIASAQLTLDASDGNLPYVEGSGGNALWQAANAALVTRAVPRLVTTVSLADLARLDPATYGDDTRIVIGQSARVVYGDRAIDGTARVVRATFDYLRPGQSAITLSDRPDELTGSLARRTLVPRRQPKAPILVLLGDASASSAFDASGALTILVAGPEGADSLRAAVSTTGMPSAATVDAATGSLRVDGTDVAALTAAGPFAAGVVVYIAVRAYRNGLGTRVLQLTDAPDAADAAQGPSLEVRLATTDTEVTVTYAAIGTVTYRLNDTLTATPASPFVLTRPAANTRPLVAVLYATRNSLVQSEPIVVPAIGEDTVTPDLVVVPVSDSQLRDRVAFTVSATDPSANGLTVTRTMTLTGCTAVGFTGAGPHTLTQGQTVQILTPLARNPGAVEFAAVITGGGRAVIQRTIPTQDLTGLGVEVLSNPEFRSDMPRRALAYDNLETGRVVLSYAAVSGQNTSGVELVITKAAGLVNPVSGGFYLNLAQTTASGWVADAYRESGLYLITVRALIPAGYAINWHTNLIGTGASWEWLTSQDGTGSYRDYVLRLQIGTGGTYAVTGFFSVQGPDDFAAVVWRVPRVNVRDLIASERQAPATVTARIVGGDADTSLVEVVISPATSASRVWLAASTESPESGPALAVEVTSGSVWGFPRRLFRTGVGSAVFSGRTPGFEVGAASVEIPEQGRDTVQLGMEITKVGGTDTTDVLRVMPLDPYPQGAGSLTLTMLPGGAPSITPAGPLALTSGTAVDVTVERPARNDAPALVSFALSNPNRVPVQRSIDVRQVRTLVPGRIANVVTAFTGPSGTVHFEAFLADGTEVDTAIVAAVLTRIPASGVPVDTTVALTRDIGNGWWAGGFTRVAGDAYRLRMVLNEDIGTARTELTIPIPTWQEPASGMSDAFASVLLTADVANNAFVPTFALASGLEGADVVASIRRAYGGLDFNVPGVEGTENYTGVISGQQLDPGPFDLSNYAGAATTTYSAHLALAAYIGTTLVGTAFGGTNFYVDNTGT